MPKKPAQMDWHRADVIAVIRKAGQSLAGLSREHGYGNMTLRNALYYPAPRYERLIAEFIATTPEYPNITAQQIWPSRYHKDGTPKSGRGERGRGRYKAKFNASASRRKVNLTGAC